MLEISRISFLVRVDEYQVEWGRSRGKGFDGFCSWTEDDVDLVDETCGGEVLGCYPNANRIYVQSGDRAIFGNGTGEPCG